MFSYNFWFKNVEFLYLTLLITVWSLFWRESDIFIFKLSWFLFLFLYVIFRVFLIKILFSRTPMNLFKRAPTRRPLSCPLCKTSVLECLSNRRHATNPPSQRARRGYHICVSWSYKFRGWPEKCKHDGVY